MPTLCESEKISHHHNQAGYGPVQNHENILYAVFSRTNLDKTDDGKDALFGKSFDKKQLISGDQSVCRLDWTTREEFNEFVVGTNDLVGGGYALAEQIRDIAFKTNIKDEAESWKKAFCVLDRVAVGEYDGHATIGYSDFYTGIQNDAVRGAVGARIRGDLAQLLMPITPPAEIPFREAANQAQPAVVSVPGAQEEEANG